MPSQDIIGAFDERPFPPSRIPTLDTLAWGRRRQHIPILLEMDVTVARAALHARKARTGQATSFTGWIICCLARAISEHPHIQAMRRGRHRLILFHDVDVTIVIERTVGQGITRQSLPMPYVIRKAHAKSLADIHAEIRAAQQAPVTAGDVQVGAADRRLIRLFTMLPKLARDLLVWRRLYHDPFLMKRMVGTVSVTSIGTTGLGTIGWGLPIGIHPLLVAVGGIVERPAFAGDQLVRREYLGMTVLFDHEVTDGAPVARFLARLQELMASGYELDGQAGNAGLPV